MSHLVEDKKSIDSSIPATTPDTEGTHQMGKSQTNDFPDGGLRAWLVAAGAATGFFATLGYTNVFGVFQAYYKFHQLPDSSEGDIAWIGGIQAWMIFAVGAISGPLFDRFGAWLIRPAAILYCFSIMMTSLCTKYWQFMLAQGILTGIANGLIMFPAMAAVPQWFDKKRGAAMGISVAGSSLGAVVFPILLSNLLTKTEVGFGWSVRIAGFLMLPFLAFTALTVRTRLPPRKTQFFLAEPFKKPLYNLLVFAIFCSMVGMFVPLFLIPTFAITRGVNQTLAGYLVAVLNGASIFGRVIPGVLGDKFGRINILIAAALSTGIITFCWPHADSTASIILVTILFGFFSGAIISGGSVAVTLCTDEPKKLGTYLGLGMALASFAALLGPPVSGAIVSSSHDFYKVSYFSGAMTMAGAITGIIAKVYSPKGLLGRT